MQTLTADHTDHVLTNDNSV